MNGLGDYVYKYRKLIVLFWAILIILFGLFAVKLPSVLSGNGFEYDGSYRQTQQILVEDFGQPRSTIILLFERNAVISDKKWRAFIEDTFEKTKKLTKLDRTITPFDQENMLKDSIAYGILTFQAPAEEIGDNINILRRVLTNEDGLTVSLTGEPVIVKDLNEASQKDLAKAEMIALPIALLVLLFSFGSLVAASIPLVIGIISILITMGIIYFFSYQIDLSIFILNIVPMIGLALSIDFALLFINRFKEEINHQSTIDAIKITVATAGRSVVFSGLCVFIGLLGLMFIQIDIFRNVAIGGMTVVFVSVLSAITFLPAILAILGKNINKLSLLKVKDNGPSFWRTFAVFVMNRPFLMSITAVLLLVTALIPVKDIHLVIPGTDALPPNYESRIAFDTFEKHFTDEEKNDENKIVIVAETESNILTEESLVKVENLIRDLTDEGIQTVESPFSLLGVENANTFYKMISTETTREQASPILDNFVNENRMLINLYMNTSQQAGEWIRKWEEKNKKTDITVHIGGYPKFEQEIFDEIYNKIPYGLALILLSTFIILTAAFRSLLIPLKAILMNILSLCASFGIVVWIFQYGNLGIEPVAIGLILPVFVFSLVFGLSMDYEVFLISRIHEHYTLTQKNDEATLEGLTSTSKIITSAAAIMIVVTGAFAFTGVMPVKQMGVGIAIAILIDATIVRMVLVPALMKLLGDWNWWFFGYKHTKKHKLERTRSRPNG